MTEEIQETPQRQARRSTPMIGVAVAVLIIAVAAVVLASQLGTPSSGGNLLLSDWQKASAEQGSYRFTMTQDVGGDDAPKGMGDLFSLEGVIDTRSGLSRTVTSINVLGTESKCTYLSKGTERTFVAVHPSRVAEFGGAKWLQSEVDSAVAGMNFPIRPDQIDDDPDRFFDDLKADGSGEIRGVKTTKYTGTFDLASLYPEQPGASPLPEEADSTIPVSVYVDQDDLLRRISLSVSSSSEISIGFTIDFFDYGKATALKEPVGDQVRDGTTEQIATACFPKDLGLRE